MTSPKVTRTSESKVDYFDQVQGFGPSSMDELSDHHGDLCTRFGPMYG